MATSQMSPRSGASDIATLIAYKAAFRRTDGSTEEKRNPETLNTAPIERRC